MPIRTRIAPTPSGYLHIGNLANFLLIEQLAKGGTLILRIDDCDGTRTRPEFVEDIFVTLHWLGIRWQEGPRDAADFSQNFSQTARKDHYFKKLDALKGKIYACACSRKEVDGVYQGTCREKGIEFEAGKHALRLRVEDPSLAKKFGDVVLWRKDGGPAYQWVSVIDDLEMKVNLIVRGEDLHDSSELQKYIARFVSPDGFDQVRFIHHPLLTAEDGKKLSKSQQAESVQDLIKQGVSPAGLRKRLLAVIQGWGIT